MRKIQYWFKRVAGGANIGDYLARELERAQLARLEAEAELESAHWAVKVLKDREIRLRAEIRRLEATMEKGEML